ncbi:MAG: hypothetical protein WKG07_11830 [Hymenobacter sp.]
MTLDGSAFGDPVAIGVDVYFNPATGLNEGYLMEVTAETPTAHPATIFTHSTWPRGLLLTAAARFRDLLVPLFDIRDIVVAIAPLTQPALVGRSCCTRWPAAT